jgi:hypothetical protein
MACSTGRCALRRFDGHGTSSYRPTNPEVAREFQSRMDQLLAERSRQDQGVFTISQSVSTQNTIHTSIPVSSPGQPSNQIPSSEQTKYYSLSDSK